MLLFTVPLLMAANLLRNNLIGDVTGIADVSLHDSSD